MIFYVLVILSNICCNLIQYTWLLIFKSLQVVSSINTSDQSAPIGLYIYL